MVRSSNLTLSFSSQTSIEEELKEKPSTPQASCLVMFAYISVALGDTPRLSSFYIASKELYLSCFLYSGSVGFFSAIGVKSTLIIMGVIPFLVLALEASFPHQHAMSSLCLQLLLITFDCLRAEDNRIGCFLCIKVPSSGGESDEAWNPDIQTSYASSDGVIQALVRMRLFSENSKTPHKKNNEAVIVCATPTSLSSEGKQTKLQRTIAERNPKMLILRHWPSHSRALPVKNTIEETELVLYAPRGIDKLEPKHVRLIFIDKRKAATEILDEGVVCKKRNQNIELCLAGSSWAALADTLLDILRSLNGCGSEVRVEKAPKSGDVRLAIRLPTSSEMVMGFGEKKGTNSSGIGEIMHVGESDSDRCIIKEKETNIFEGQLLERRSTRLERLRSRKPGKEEEDFANDKDVSKNVLQFFESFITGLSEKKKDCNRAAISFLSCPDHANSLDIECCDVTTFMGETSKNYGAYRMGHLLLEHAARRSLMCHDAFLKFMELEKLTRYSGLDRTTECSLFLPELYYDLGSSPSNVLKRSEFISEASYHLCKIIESVSLDYPFDFTCAPGNVNCSSKESFQDQKLMNNSVLLCLCSRKRNI
ncbi:hypothetical protein WN943_000538 [Citrus x changshan-huyou]